MDNATTTLDLSVPRPGFVNQIGSPVEVFDKPVNLFVAGFIGMPVMNFFDNCKLLLEDDTYYAQIRNAKIRLDDFQQKALKQNGQKACDIVADIRPQHIGVGSGDLVATIEVNEMMDSEVHLHARSDADEVVMVIPIVVLKVDVYAGGQGKLHHPAQTDPTVRQGQRQQSGVVRQSLRRRLRTCLQELWNL